MKIEDMNEGVRILLERMETHPQEFNHGINIKWGEMVGDIMQRAKGVANVVPFLHDDEVKAIYDKLRDLERHEFTARVLRKLADTPEEDYDPDAQLNLPYVPSIPNMMDRKTFGLDHGELKEARKLGVTPQVYAESKRRQIERQREFHRLHEAYEASKKKGNK